MQMQLDSLAVWYPPVLALDPRGEELTQLHGEAVTVQVIELLQVARLQLLQLIPLGHDDLLCSCPGPRKERGWKREYERERERERKSRRERRDGRMKRKRRRVKRS